MRIKKIIALCIFAILIPMCAYAQDDDLKFDTAYTLLHDLNVVEEKPSDTDSSVTRGDFVGMFIRALNIDLSSSPEISAFSDVYHSDKNYAEINAGYEMGYISGYDDKTFRPDENISFSHCLDLANKALGYNKLGISVFNKSNKINDGITKIGNEVSYHDAVVLIYNMLMENTMEADYSKVPVEYNKSKNSLLYDMWNIYSVRGQITQTAYTGLSTGADCGKDRIKIGDTTYVCTIPDINEKLGFSVTAFICDKDDVDTVVSIADRKNTVVNLKADTLRKSSYKNNVFEYTDASGSTHKFKMLPAIDIIYNDVFAGSQFENSIIENMSLGEVDIIDSDDDGVYDILKVYDYKILTAGNNTSENARRIYDKYIPQNYIEVEATNDYDLVNLSIDGRIGKTSEIVFGDVIAYYENTNESGTKIVQMRINRTVTTGVLESMSEDYYVVDGKRFPVNPELADRAKNNKYGNAPSLGSTQTFYLDYIGQISLVLSENQSEYSYGLLCNVYVDYDECYIKMFTPANSFVTYKADDKLVIDGGRIRDLNNISTILDQTKLSICNGDGMYQIVRYVAKGDKITQILTTSSNNDNSPRLDYDFKNRSFKNLGFVFGTSMRDFRANQYSNVVFMPTLTDKVNPDRFYWGDLSNLVNGDTMNSQAYNVDESGCAELILLSTDFKESYGNAPAMYIVQSNNLVIDENDELVRHLAVVQKGVLYNYYTESGDTETASDIGSGDVIQIVMDPFNKVIFTKQILDFDAPKLLHGFNSEGVSSYTAAIRHLTGYIESYKNGWATVTYAQDKSADLTQEPYKDLVNIGSLTFSVYDEATKKVTTGKAANLPGYISTSGDDYMIFLYSNYGQLVDMFVYVLE